MATHGVSIETRPPHPGKSLGGRPLSCCGAEKWSPIRSHLGPRQDRARARAVVPPALRSFMSWPRVACICWTRRPMGRMARPSSAGNGTTGGPCCNARDAFAPCPRLTGTRQSGPTSAYVGSGRRQRKSGVPVLPSDRTLCHLCHPGRWPRTPCRRAPRSSPGEGRVPRARTLKPNRAQPIRRWAGPRDSSCPWTSP